MGNYRLKKAILATDVNLVSSILSDGKQGIIINGAGPKTTPPIVACVLLPSIYQNRIEQDDARRCEILKLLVQYGADVNVRGEIKPQHQWTATLCACRRGFLKCLQFLGDSGADLGFTSDIGETTLIVAASCVKYVLQHMCSSMLNHRDNRDRTALMYAAKAKCAYRNEGFLCVKYLVQAGAEINAKDYRNETALMFALHTGLGYAVSLFLEQGSEITTVSNSGATPLSIAHWNAPKLLRFGLDPTLSRYDQRLLHTAIEEALNGAVRALVMNGFPALDITNGFNYIPREGPSVPPRGAPLVSPLETAICHRRPDIAKYLVANGLITRYDIVHLCCALPIRQSLQGFGNNPAESHKTRQCLDILDFLSSRPQSLKDICLLSITSALSQDFALDPQQTPAGIQSSVVTPDQIRNNFEQRFVCVPTYKERVNMLQLPNALKRALLHETHLSGICCQSWGGRLL